MAAIFHLSIPVDNLDRARAFYVDLLGCEIGRSAPRRMDINFFGHHIVAHLAPKDAAQQFSAIGTDNDPSPVRHFGVILPQQEWERIAGKVKAARVEFVVPPQVIHRGRISEQSIMLMRDTCGNVVELKSLPPERVFAQEKKEP